MSHPSGRHFLQIPGPTNVPGRVLRAMAAPTIDHRGPAFQALIYSPKIPQLAVVIAMDDGSTEIVRKTARAMSGTPLRPCFQVIAGSIG